jgi:broad specificity phosphatase PhoE
VSVILLVRHGQASWGSDDYDQLSDFGVEQAKMVGKSLADRGVRPALLVSGSMRRHLQTCDGAKFGSGWTHEVDVDPGWNEFDPQQVLEVHEPPETAGAEMSKQEFQSWFETATDRWISGDYDEEYDESFTHFTTRVSEAFGRLSQRLGPSETAVVFTSGGPVSWVAAALLGGGAALWTKLNPVTVNSSVTKLIVGGRGTTLVGFNDHGHLEPDSITYR